MQEHRAYIGVGARLAVLDVSDPGLPCLVGESPSLGDEVTTVVIGDTHAYLGAGHGVHILQLTDLTHMAEVGGVQMATNVQDIAVADRHIFIAGLSSGLHVIDVVDPARPSVTGFHALAEPWVLGVTVAGRYAYVANQHTGLHIIDVSKPALPVEVGHYYAAAIRTAIVGSLAFLVQDPGPVILDVSAPSNPMALGFTKIVAPNDIAVRGSFAYVASYDGLWVIDVADPAHPTEVGRYQVPNCYSLALAGAYAYLACGANGLQILDIAEPTIPRQVGHW
jgi:hypothetical protein